MILSDSVLEALVQTDAVLEDYDPALIKYCGYELRLGKVFMPESGEAQGGVASSPGGVRAWIAGKLSGVAVPSPPTTWVIGRSETMVVVTKETVRIPKTFCATYGQLNRLANHGLMVLNTSIVEPGYAGPLSCVLVNFSSQKIILRQDQPIAKISFHRLEGAPGHLQPSFDRASYENRVAEAAIKLPKSFLDISGVEERVTLNVNAKVKQTIFWGSAIIVFLLAWSQLEGFASDWIWKRTGLMSNSKQIELSYMQQQLKTEQSLLDLNRSNRELENTVKDLSRTIADLKATAARQRSIAK